MDDAPSPRQLVDRLVALLTVSNDGDGRYIGAPQRGGVGRMFGGQVIAQALQSAQLSVPSEKIAHSLHAYFLRGGKEGPPVEYTVDRDFDGRSFANRRVVARQDGTPILNMTASFQTAEDGLEHDHAAMPDVEPPEDLKPDMELRRDYADALPDLSDTHRNVMLRPRPIEMRTVDRLHWMNSEPRAPQAHSWFRTAASLPDDLAMHRAIITYASDYTLLGTAALPHGLSWMRGELNGASLDHAIWFHRDARADEWLLYATDSPWSGGGRGFNRGRIFTRDGALIASVAQEGVIRKRRNK